MRYWTKELEAQRAHSLREPQRTPIFMARPNEGTPPHNYVVLLQRTLCVNCGSTHELSSITAKTFLYSRLASRQCPNQRPVRSPSEITYNLPVEMELRPIERIPFCHECFESVSLSHLPAPPQPQTKVIIGSGLTNPPKANAPKAKAKFTIDNL